MIRIERAPDVAQALRVAAEHVIERRALVPGFGVKRRAAQERREPCFSYVVAPRRDVARRGLQDGCRGATIQLAYTGTAQKATT